MSFLLRPATDDDLPRLLPLYEVMLGRALTLDYLRIRAERFSAQSFSTHSFSIQSRWLIEDGGEVLAVCDWEANEFGPPGSLRLSLLVLPGARGRGFGSALLRLAEQMGAPLTANVPDDNSRSLAWAERRGFTVHAHRFESLLNPQMFEPDQHAAPLPKRVTLSDMTRASPADWDDFTALLIETFAQTPDAQGLPRWSAETARQALQLHPQMRPDWIICARRGERTGGGLISFTAALNLSSTVYNQMTGVADTARGLGLASALKGALLRRLKAQGVTQIRTHNHAANAPMLRVNEKLGYRRQSGRWEVWAAPSKAKRS